ncbi:MAG: response regulator [Anaerolineae bacterium]|nr:response regulator [Anaerolineae bacterium]
MERDEPLSRDQVHQALEALYDNVQLAHCDLVTRFSRLADIGRLDERAERARALFLEAIEVLRPARSVPFGSPESRFYDLLSLRYVENLTLPQVMRELSLSRRQVYRDLAEAEEKLAQVLASWLQAQGEEAEPSRRGLLSDELAALPAAAGEVQLGALLQEVADLVGGLADRLGVSLHLPQAEVEPGPLVLADRAILKQVLVQLLSGAVQSSPGGLVRVEVQSDESTCSLGLVFALGAGQDIVDTALVMAASQRLAHRLDRRDDGQVEVRLELRRGQPASVLIVEDNPGAVELYRRYLSGGRWRVSSVPNPTLALEIARRTRPDVIVLDILMPGLDGWSIIKGLRQHEDTRDIPLLVCSVLEDPSLAGSLGANAYLTKPVSRAHLLRALGDCLAPRPAPADDC